VASAKVRELVVFIDLHLELVARELYPKAFFGGTISESNAERIRKLLEKNIAGFKRLAKFSPYVAGNASRKPTVLPGRVFRWSEWRPRRSTAATC
jgi:hypothetical protein